MSGKTILANGSVLAEVLHLVSELQNNAKKLTDLAKQKAVPVDVVASTVYEYEETREALQESVGEIYAALSLLDPEDRELTARLEEEEDEEEDEEEEDEEEEDDGDEEEV